MTPFHYNVFVSPVGNVYMTELASMLVDTIGETGRGVDLLTDGLPRSEPNVVNLVVAPHEFFVLQDGPTEVELVRAATQSITIGMEQPGTVWFEEGARYASYGPMAFDINQRGVRELRRRGIDAHQLQLGYHPGWDVWRGSSDRRDTDVMFLGALTPRRSEFLARSAPTLSDWECDIRLFEVSRPVKSGSDHFVTGRRKHHALANCRILLNVHQSERDYFEWLRVIEAISNGCLVVTETSAGFEPLVPSQHFVQTGLDELSGRLDCLLRDEELREELAKGAYDFLVHHLAMTDIVDKVLEELEHRVQPSSRSVRPDADLRLPSELRQVGSRRPFIVPIPHPTDLHRLPARVGNTGRMISAIKGLLSMEVKTTRVIEAVTSTIEFGSPVVIETFDTPAFAEADPEVSVVIPVSNAEHSVRQAISSVAASEQVRLELVLVDDHSTDDSASVARATMTYFDHIPIRLVTRSASRGVAAARNTGFEHARAEFVFLSDVHGEAFPLGVHRLLAAMRESDAAFAYGLIQQPGPVPFLDSCLPWDVQRLVESNYIDTMSLIRASVWKTIGGFDDRAELSADLATYDFWLHLAAQGQEGQLVPNFIGRYRPHDSSLQSALAFEPEGRSELFASRYPRLSWEPSEVLR